MAIPLLQEQEEGFVNMTFGIENATLADGCWELNVVAEHGGGGLGLIVSV